MKETISKELLKNFCNKTIMMTKYIKKEYDDITKKYNEENIYKNCYPIKVSKKANAKQKEDINYILDSLFKSNLSVMSKMIDDGIIEWESVSKEVQLDEFKEKDFINNLIYEAWDKLYILKHIKYNLTMNFIMQLYLFLEKEINTLVIKLSDNPEKNLTLFSSIRLLEKDYNIVFSNEIKSKLNLYRNVINVHKHGSGISFDEIIKEYDFILNNKTVNNNDSSFVFKPDYINVNDIYNVINKFVYEINLECGD